jgi:large subunit ribosomal protein LP0
MKLRELGCVMLVGKNTVIRPVILDAIEKGNKKLQRLLPFVQQNVGFVFTNTDDLAQIRDLITENKIPAAARTGVIAPVDVHIPAGPTPLDPGMFYNSHTFLFFSRLPHPKVIDISYDD